MPRRPSYDRDDLIARARDLFWAQGWAGTSMKDLERALGLKPGSFYAAFGSKDALYGLALDLYAQEGNAALAALAQELGAFGALQALPARLISADCDTKACMISKTLLELPQGRHELGQRADALLTRKEAEFTALFAQAQEAGEIAPDYDPVRLARRYQSELIGLRVTAERSPEAALDIAHDMAADLVRMRTAAA